MSSEKKATLYSEYAVDVESGETGKWVDSFRGGIRVKMRSTNSKVVRTAQEKINTRNLKYIRRNATIPVEVQEKNATETACAIVADWENVTDEHGNAVPGTSEDGKKSILGDPRLREFRDTIIGTAATFDTFRADAEADAENLSPASVPSSTPEAPQPTPVE